MAKKLFKNYTFEFDKNERKVLSTFCKQALSQMAGDDRFFREVRVFNSLLDKLNSGDDEIKLTKEEATKLSMQLRENLKHIEKEMNNSWFIKKWLMRSVYKQYQSIIANHFSD